MITVVYASRATHAMGESDLEGLLVAARTRNEAAGVTGMLLYAYGSFMQQLEGDAAAVGAIFASIRADPRHVDVRTLSDRSIAHRTYPRWSMGFASLQPDELAARLPGFRPTADVPLVDSRLVEDSFMAERILALVARGLLTTT